MSAPSTESRERRELIEGKLMLIASPGYRLPYLYYLPTGEAHKRRRIGEIEAGGVTFETPWHLRPDELRAVALLIERLSAP